MSVSGASSTASLYIQGTQSNQAYGFKQRQSQLAALSQALSAGDLSAARNAFSAFQQGIQGATQTQNGQPAAQSTQSAENTVQGALQALGQALSGGNLSAAQSAFATLQQDLQNAGQSHHHHHHHHQGASGQAGTSNSGSGTNTASTNTINVKA